MRHKGIIALVVVAVVSGPVAVHLVHDSEVRLRRQVELFDALRGLTSLQNRLAEETLAIRLGVPGDGDDLGRVVAALRLDEDRIAAEVGELDAAGLSERLDRYRAAARDQREAVRAFEADQVALRDAQRRLSIASSRALEEIEHSALADRGHVEEDAEGIVVRTLATLLTGADDPELVERLAHLERHIASAPLPATRAFVHHGSAALELTARARVLTASITDGGARAVLAELRAAYDEVMAAEIERGDAQRRVLAATAVVLGLVVAAALLGIRRSATRLQTANEGLEEEIGRRSVLLAQTQKLESIGQLAAGIAHEINTPAQYVSDNVEFLDEGFGAIRNLLEHYETVVAAVDAGTMSAEHVAGLRKALEEADAEFLLDEIPRAIAQSRDGITRVAKIVGAMKEFSHPGSADKKLVDLNHAIESTITVARNEWKYVAELETDFDADLPLVPCHADELNQVILNVLVNAAQAIGDSLPDGSLERGTIRVRTRREGAHQVLIEIADTGPGIPEAIRARVFDPFFTTKDVGKGTGQGLAIARSVVVDKHGGAIDLESEPGQGTTFRIHLPLDSTERASRHEEAA